MAKSVADWLLKAQESRILLDDAIDEKNDKQILHYRGRMLFYLKRAYKLNPSASLSIDGTVVPLKNYIASELKEHQKMIGGSIQNNRLAKNGKPKITKELGLKLRRLSTRASQINFATDAAVKKQLRKDIVKDSVGLAGSALIKAPIMATAKVASKVGPLAIGLFLMPAKLFGSFLSWGFDVTTGQVSQSDYYNGNAISQVGSAIQNAFRTIPESIYNSVSRL